MNILIKNDKSAAIYEKRFKVIAIFAVSLSLLSLSNCKVVCNVYANSPFIIIHFNVLSTGLHYNQPMPLNWILPV